MSKEEWTDDEKADFQRVLQEDHDATEYLTGVMGQLSNLKRLLGKVAGTTLEDLDYAAELCGDSFVEDFDDVVKQAYFLHNNVKKLGAAIIKKYPDQIWRS
jgi:hypothetical protein